MAHGASVVWFRNDLRLADNPALSAAVARGGPIISLFIWAPEEERRWPPGAASRWWLHQSLTHLDADLRKRGSRLIVERGPSLNALTRVLKATKAVTVFWNRRYEPAIVARDQALLESLKQSGVEIETFAGNLLFEPSAVTTKAGKPYRVFTPFWKACLALDEPSEPVPVPYRWKSPARWPKSLKIDALELEPKIDWASGFDKVWTPGERGAAEKLKRFRMHAFSEYGSGRNRPDVEGTSRLSPHLHFGEITPRQVWHALADKGGDGKSDRSIASQRAKFRAELGWREFAHHVLFHFPETAERPLREDFTNFPWRKNAKALKAWQRGQTGFPIVDAGMRELWTTGWMHNRVRMIVASFLTKDLLQNWRAGADWFWDTLVDADLANNTLGWQWTAGCGADAAPFFRIFNPVLQGQKFDPMGEYVRKWVTELADLPLKFLHEPSKASEDVLELAGVRLGENYPQPIVAHSEARTDALAAFRSIRG